MKKCNYSNEIANVVKQFLTDDGWLYSFDEECGIFEFGLRVRSKIQKIKYFIDIKEDEMIVYGICPIGADWADERMMAQMAEFICRANYGLKNGCFEFDFGDGEIRYKSFIDCDEVLPSTEVVKNSVHCTAAMYKHYAAGITSIIFAGSSAKEAIAMCEKSSDEELRSMLAEMGADAEDGDMSGMIARLAERLGITSEEEVTTSETVASEEAAEVHVDLFGRKKAEEA